MAIRLLKAKVKEAAVALNTLMRDGCASKTDCVLVVYGGGAASIYYEGDGGPQRAANLDVPLVTRGK